MPSRLPTLHSRLEVASARRTGLQMGNRHQQPARWRTPRRDPGGRQQRHRERPAVERLAGPGGSAGRGVGSGCRGRSPRDPFLLLRSRRRRSLSADRQLRMGRRSSVRPAAGACARYRPLRGPLWRGSPRRHGRSRGALWPPQSVRQRVGPGGGETRSFPPASAPVGRHRFSASFQLRPRRRTIIAAIPRDAGSGSGRGSRAFSR